MTDLRKSAIDSVYNAINSTYFGVDNFEFQFPHETDILVEIVFLAVPTYIYAIHYSNGKEVVVVESPGVYQISDESGEITFQSAVNGIENWTEHIRKELSSIGVREKQTDDVIDEINIYIDSLDNPAEAFTDNEVETLTKQLSELKKKFEELLEKNTITENELKRLKSHIENAETDLKVFSKEIWYKISMRKIVGTTKSILTSKEGKDIAVKLVKKLIGL